MALTTETVYSKVEDKNIKTNVQKSKIWANCEHPDDVEDKDLTGWFQYQFKFDGLVPIQCIKIKKIK